MHGVDDPNQKSLRRQSMEYVIKLIEDEIKHLNSLIDSSYDRENAADFYEFRCLKEDEILKCEEAIAKLKAAK